MRTTLLAMTMVLIGCGSGDDGDTLLGSPDCVVIPLAGYTTGCANDPIDLASNCTRGSAKLGHMDTMTVYVAGERISRDEWQPLGNTTFTLSACEHGKIPLVSVSFGCVARELVLDGTKSCGYVNANVTPGPGAS